ncbi:MAG: hypothetical protein A3D64_02565 [Candidatus Wildermuthbacteria bacterium RIFCSPHIGHO2_02_FULL_49_9]|uniref:DUF2061 domain-containing protein n=2 Tax=Candidatus Wildermuthiibacteriota TaxID=1817923 RepID=A0A1G2QXI3_9BACT|nr:MAG: hypothetical protein A2672_03140 [Candidatus Wildermuthbacteria bacterium RIFCSPHIGHO2_01_FULL_49_22b]OHA71375.1 MAG: hypothetical protein A3D64_02565 [Candidatus Wildermuthbacteria bacterium RIFCSPHIGHO2_02_FULL_49_9]
MKMNMHPKLREFFGHFYFAVEWRIIAIIITFLAAYIISGDIKISLGITSIESVAKMIVQTFWLQYRVKNHHIAHKH